MVGGERGHRARDPLGGQRAVLDEQPSPGVDHRTGVEVLLAVADRQRHEHRGQSDGGDLGDGVGPGAADHEVGRGVGEVHAVDVREDDVGHLPGCRATVASPLAPTTCSTWTPASAKLRSAAGDGLVDPSGALGAPEHQHGGAVGIEAEGATGLVPQRRPVERRDHPADRQPDVRRVAQRGVGKLVATCVVNRAPSLFAMPGSALPSWTTIGTCRRRAAR